jgi:hypothetical protein
MSKIAFTPNASGSGTFTLASPNSNTDRSLTLPDGAGTIDRLERAGNVLQVKNFIKTDIATFSAGSWHTVMELSITPLSTSSDILVTSVVAISQAGGDSMVRIERDGTAVGIGTGGSTLNGIAGQPSGSYSAMTAVAACSYLDSPSKSTSVVYKIQCRSPSNTIYINRRGGAADFGGASYLTLMEIAG